MGKNREKMTTEDFIDILTDLMNEDGVSVVLRIPGVYEVVSEYYNNEVLEVWDESQE